MNKIHDAKLLAAREVIIKPVFQPGGADYWPCRLFESNQQRTAAHQAPLCKIPACQHRSYPANLLRLTNCEHLVGFHVLENLVRTAGPEQFKLLHQRSPAEAKMNAHVGTAGITDARADGIVLDAVFRDQANARSNAITVALPSDCPDEQPVIRCRADVV